MFVPDYTQLLKLVKEWTTLCKDILFCRRLYTFVNGCTRFNMLVYGCKMYNLLHTGTTIYSQVQPGTTRDKEGRMELVPYKMEESIFWSESYKISRLHGFSPTTKSFLFQLIHTFLPCKARVSRIIQANSSLCYCKGWKETFITFSANASRTRRLDKLFLDALGRLPLF